MNMRRTGRRRIIHFVLEQYRNTAIYLLLIIYCPGNEVQYIIYIGIKTQTKGSYWDVKLMESKFSEKL